MRNRARKYDRTDRRASRFGAVWRIENQRRFKFFEVEKERDKWLVDFNRQVARQGEALLGLTAVEAAIMRECVDKLGSASDVLRVVCDHERRTRSKSVALSAAIKEFIDEKTNAGFADDYIRHTKLVLDRLPWDGTACAVTAADAKAWAATLPNAPRTVRGYIKIVRTFWRWLVRHGYAVENVFELVILPPITETEPGFLTVEQTRALFAAAADQFPDAVAYLALGAFAGLRSTACVRIHAQTHIRWDQRGILISGDIAKNKRRQYIDGHEPVLWHWLEWARKNAPKGFALNARLWERRREQVAQAAGVKMPHNALRHSFCTYHVALHGDAGKTATLLTHRGNVSVLYEHYKGNATKEQAARYFRATSFDFVEH